jgi:hypothetical protein
MDLGFMGNFRRVLDQRWTEAATPWLRTDVALAQANEYGMRCRDRGERIAHCRGAALPPMRKHRSHYRASAFSVSV